MSCRSRTCFLFSSTLPSSCATRAARMDRSRLTASTSERSTAERWRDSCRRSSTAASFSPRSLLVNLQLFSTWAS